MLSYSKDGNFQHSQHIKKMDKEDIPLTKGAAYYADENEYEQYVRKSKGTDADKEVCFYDSFRTKSYTNK